MGEINWALTLTVFNKPIEIDHSLHITYIKLENHENEVLAENIPNFQTEPVCIFIDNARPITHWLRPRPQSRPKAGAT